MSHTDQERAETLGADLAAGLADCGLVIMAADSPVIPPSQSPQQLANLWGIAEEHVLEVRAEELLEQLAEEHGIECELVRVSDQPEAPWWIYPADKSDDGQDFDPLATGSIPLEAVEALRRELEAS